MEINPGARGLTNPQLAKLAPAIFAEEPHRKLSDKYVFIPTINIVDDLRNLGWYPYRVQQANVRNPEITNKQVHKIIFRQEKDIVNPSEIVNELLSINSHDGRIKLSFYSGIFRTICTNGMVVMEQNFGGFTIKHIGYTFEDIESLVINHIQSMNQVVNKIKEYQSIELTAGQQLQLASIAHDILKLNSNLPQGELIKPRRTEDEKNDLWTVWNRIQENVTQGGMRFHGEKRTVVTKRIDNIKRNTKINITLWELLNQTYARYK